MEDLAVFTVLNHSGSFGKNFVKFKKNKYATHSALPITTPSLTPTIIESQLVSEVWGKNSATCISMPSCF